MKGNHEKLFEKIYEICILNVNEKIYQQIYKKKYEKFKEIRQQIDKKIVKKSMKIIYEKSTKITRKNAMKNISIL